LRFLANENFPAAAVASPAAAGHDVVWVRTAAPGVPDPEVLAWASREHRILLTFDKDFGELARGSALPRACGVVLLRMPMPKPEEARLRLAALITAREGRQFLGHRARPRSDATARVVCGLVKL
jgi:predicted nuclease of predicted toxin-antitoxin system